MPSRVFLCWVAIGFVCFAGGCLESPTVTLVEQSDAGAGAGAKTTLAAATDGSSDATNACDDRCRTAGGTCSAGACVIRCPGAATCEAGIECPAGLSCTIECTGKHACASVDCSAANACDIRCDGDAACEGKIACGGDVCSVACVDGGCKPDDVRCCASTCTVNGKPGRCN